MFRSRSRMAGPVGVRRGGVPLWITEVVLGVSAGIQSGAPPRRAPRMLTVLALALANSLLVACRQHMADQPSYRPYDPSSFYADGASARPIQPDTVARGSMRKVADMGSVDQLPHPVDRTMLERGRNRFNIYCAPCHGEAGYGDGVIIQRGFSQPPSYHSDRLRQAPLGHFYDVATNGYGSMPSYATLVSTDDRWAIVAYIRALQLSQNASIADLPAESQAALGSQP
jgi:mono/diheme cytochrome c family protein